MTEHTPTADCRLCAREDEGYEPPGGWVWRDKYWSVGILEGLEVPGWLLVQSRPHVERLWDVDDGGPASLGPVLAATSEAVHQELGAERVYLISFNEGMTHWHMVIQARPDGVTEEAKGPNLLRRASDFIDTEAAARVAAAVRERLSARA